MKKIIENLTKNLISSCTLWTCIFIAYILIFYLPTLLGANIGLSADQLLENFSHFFEWKLVIPLLGGYVLAKIVCRSYMLLLKELGKDSSKVRNAWISIKDEVSGVLNGLSTLALVLMLAEISLHGLSYQAAHYLKFCIFFRVSVAAIEMKNEIY